MAAAPGINWEVCWKDDTWATPSWETEFVVYNYYINSSGEQYYQNDNVDWYLTKTRSVDAVVAEQGQVAWFDQRIFGTEFDERIFGAEIGS